MSDYLQDRLVAAVGDHYLIEKEIGRGGMAVVYCALDLRLNRRVAIKLLPPDLAFNADVKTRFLREAQMAAQLNHPNIVPIYSVDERDGVVYFVMALVEGETLAQQLERVPRAEIEQVRRVIGDVADALDYAHRKGVVHRDIKPDNIMLDRASGRTMVTDFGIARAAAGDSRLTVTGVAVGTPAYMSPEQALGERDVDGRSDIYSLGIVAYQMLVGEPPFKASNTPAMLVKHVAEAPPSIRDQRPDAPESVVHAVEVALRKKPEERWPDGAAFTAAIRALAPTLAPRAEQLQPTGVLRRVADEPPRANLAPPPYGGVSLRVPALSIQIPPIPVGGTRDAWRAWKEQVKSQATGHPHFARGLMRDALEENRQAWRAERKNVRRSRRERNRDRPIEERAARYGGQLISTISTIGVLFGINYITSPGFWWWLFPAIPMAVGVAGRGVQLWYEGATLKQLFTRGNPSALSAARAKEQMTMPAISEAPLASDEVLAGPHGLVLRRVLGDRIVIREVLAKLTPAERQMLPEIEPTVASLSDRIASLATTLHRLDADVSGANLGALDERVAQLKSEPETAERSRRVALLERQRSTLHDLIERRRTLMGQFESACLALENLKFDLLKLRSAGVDAALSSVSSATQEARSISREIGHAIEAAEEVRRL